MDRREERKRGFSRVVRLGQDDGSFDAEFWSRLTPEQRLELIWDMTREAMAMKGIDEHQLRLQRSIARVERR
ncbi:MAG: hypothetical protein HYZ28_15255 [Myxococcales bacterium]|nr:hypothetical protein [Myxococcales bacterium]